MRKSKAFLADREKEIVGMVNASGSVTVDEICARFHISPSAARNQLNVLQGKGLVLRTRGGASRAASLEAPRPAESGVLADICVNRPEKEAIARAARSFIQDGDAIGICGGSTTYMLSRLLRDAGRLIVVTNSILIANELIGCPQLDVRVCGGVLNHKKGSLNGPVAEEYFRGIRLDKVFIGADSFLLDYGAMSGDSIMSHLEHTVLSQAREGYILVDHTKFNKNTTVDCVAPYDMIDCLVTDGGIDSGTLGLVQSMGVKVAIGE